MKSSKRLKFDDAAVNVDTTPQCTEAKVTNSGLVQDKNPTENNPKNTYKATTLGNRLADLGM